MPVLAFGFGSFGDILAAVQLAVRIAIILRQSGNSIECAETEKELKALSGDLDLADRTLQQTSGSSLAPFVAARIRDEVVQCHKLMARFFMKITAPQSFVQKIRWAASQEKELAKFRTQINERRSALGLVMDVINSLGCRGALMAVRDRIDGIGGQVRQGHTLIQDVHNGVNNVAQRLDEVGGQVRQGHSLIQDGVSGLLQQLATYHEQVVAIIKHVPDGISEAMFVVISPIGIPIPISLTFCTSFNLLDHILERYMRGRKEAGGRYVERGDYRMISPEGDIINPPAFIRTLKAGVRLEMSIVKWGSTLYKCPQCKSPVWDSIHVVAHWTTCQNPNCGSRFRTQRSPIRPTSVTDPTEDEDVDEPCFRLIEVVALESTSKEACFRIYRNFN
ncbi:hypothetical protein DFH09DRAFT_1279210 [Mycena vulgaris]|nr:hypothetical protein DFH09DRAFT_1279210 [Mycena vulgaris]